MSLMSYLYLLVLLDLPAKATLLLLAACAACVFLRRSSAATRHLTWSAALIGVLLVPLLATALPRWDIPLFFLPNPSVAASAPSDTMPPLVPPAAASLDKAAPPSPTTTEGSAPPDAATATQPIVAEPTRRFSFSFSKVLLAVDFFFPLISLVGTLAVLCHFAVGLRRVGRVRRAALPLEGTALEVAEAARRQLGLRRPVTFLKAAETDAIAVPMTWGILRPVVLLPPQSSVWSESCLRAALLHELAHVQRWDWTTQLLSRLAYALCWWHPLAWWAARQARMESERACDDLVLGTGMGPSDYAQHLIEVVRSMPVGKPARTAAIAMAEPSEVEGRVKAVLAKGRDRSHLSRRRIVVITMIFCVLPISLAMLRPVARALPTDASRTTAEPIIPLVAGYQTTLPNGYTLGVAGISRAVLTPNGRGTLRGPFWTPDGKPFPNPMVRFKGDLGPWSATMHDERALDLTLTNNHTNRHNNYPSTYYEIVGTGSRERFMFGSRVMRIEPTTIYDPLSKGMILPAYFSSEARSCSIRYGVAAGPWHTVASLPVRLRPAPWRMTIKLGDKPTIDYQNLNWPNRVYQIDAFLGAAQRMGNTARRAVVVDAFGQQTPFQLGLGSRGLLMAGLTFRKGLFFRDSPGPALSHVKTILLQSRPYQFAVFRNIPLQPAAQARGVQSLDAAGGPAGRTPLPVNNLAASGPWDWVVLPSTATTRPLTFEDRVAGNLLCVLHAEDGYDPTTRTLHRVTLAQYQEGRVSSTTHSDDAQWLGSVLTLHNVSTQTYGADGRVKGQDHAESVTASPLSARGTLSAPPVLGGGAVAETPYQQRAQRAIRAATSAGEGRMGILNIPKTWQADPTSFRSALHLLGVTVDGGNALSTTDQRDSVAATDPRTGQRHQFMVEAVFEGTWQDQPRGWLARSFRPLTWDRRMDGRPLTPNDVTWMSIGGTKPYNVFTKVWPPLPPAYPWWTGDVKG